MLTDDKLTSKELHSYLISTVKVEPSSNTYFEDFSRDDNIDLKAIYMLPRKTACDTYLRSFQYKILSNIIFLK